MNPLYRARAAAGRLRWTMDRYAAPTYSQEGEDRILARIFESQPTGTYVDVGAHHPRRFSNTLLLYRRGWSGLNVDPLPGTADRFRRERARDVTVECGIGRTAGTATFTQFVEPALSTFDQEVAALRRSEGHAVATTREVPLVPLRELIDRHLPGRHIDLLTVDVEGMDVEVLETADLDHHRPSIVCIESYVTDLRVTTEGDQLLHELGYILTAGTGYSRIYRRSDRSALTTRS